MESGHREAQKLADERERPRVQLGCAKSVRSARPSEEGLLGCYICSVSYSYALGTQQAFLSPKFEDNHKGDCVGERRTKGRPEAKLRD